MTVFDADVIVVGAGPAGLMLAAEVASAGLSYTVLERRSEESNVTRAFAVHARTLEVLDVSTATNGKPPITGRAGYSSPVTLPIATHPPADLA